MLNLKLRGHDAYYGVTGNYRMLEKLRLEVAKLWRKWLGRRNRGRPPTWDQFDGLLRIFPLIPAKTVHSAIRLRTAASTSGRSPRVRSFPSACGTRPWWARWPSRRTDACSPRGGWTRL